MEYKQYHEKNVKVNNKKVKDYYTFKLEGDYNTYCGKIERHWTSASGEEMFAIRDNDGYITISCYYSEHYFYCIGSGHAYCFRVEDIEDLICKIEREYEENFH